MQTVMNTGETLIELIPGAVLRVSAIDGSGYASLTLAQGGGSAVFFGSTTAATGTASAGPFLNTVSILVRVKGKAAVYQLQPDVQLLVSGAGISRSGVSLSSPLATLSGVTGGLFSAAGFPYSFAPGALANVNDVLHVMAMVRKRGANATATVNAYLGVNNSTADGKIGALLATNVTDQDVFLVATMFVGSATNGIANQGAAWNSQGQSRFFDVALTPASTMYLNIGVTGANALDSFDLLAVRHWIEKAVA